MEIQAEYIQDEPKLTASLSRVRLAVKKSNTETVKLIAKYVEK